MTKRYDDIQGDLRKAYDSKVDERDQTQLAPWKIPIRQDFLTLLKAEEKISLLEIGAGTGVHGLFFQQHGLKVTVTDLSPGMVARCREKGLDAYVMDFLNLDFPASTFDAVFAMNCLLHVPKVDFSRVLIKIHALLKPGALFFLGQHGGYDWEGSWEGDHYEPKRHYVFWSDEGLRDQLEPLFDVLRFESIPHDDGDGKIYFQAFFLRKAPV